MRLLKLRRFLLIFLISVIGILALLFASLNLPFSQRFVTRQVNQILSGSNVPVHINAIKRILPNSVIIQGVVIADLNKDTIIYADELETDCRLFALMHRKVVLQDLDLSQVSVKILKNGKTLKYNIAETFKTVEKPEKSIAEKEKAYWMISIKNGSLSSINFHMTDSITGIHIHQEIAGIGLKNFKISLADREILAHTLELVGATGNVTLTPRKAKQKSRDGLPWDFGLMNLSMNEIDFTYHHGSESLLLHLILGDGMIRANQMELLERVIDMKEISLAKATATIRSSNQSSETKATPKPAGGRSPWVLKGKDIDLEDVGIRLGNYDVPGMDSSGTRMSLAALDMKLRGLILDEDHAGVKVKQVNFDLDNGFSLKKMKGELDSDGESTMLDLAIETEYSQVNLEGWANQFIFDIFSKPADVQKANIAISETSISLKDVSSFISELQDNPHFMTMAGKPYSISGDMGLVKSAISFSGFSFSQDRNFTMALDGIAENPFQFSNAKGDLNLAISEIDTAWLKKIIAGFGMDHGIPDISELTLEGHVSNAFMSPDFTMDLKSNMGSILGSGSLNFNTDSFSLHSSFDRILLGEVLDMPELGYFTGSAKFSGYGFSSGSFHSNLSLLVDSLEFNGYNYTQTSIEGIVQPGEYDFHIVASDPFFKGDLMAHLIPADPVFQVKASGTVFAQLNELHLFNNPLAVETNLEANLIHKQNAIESDLTASGIVLTTPHQTAEIQQIHASFKTDSVNTLLISEADFFNVDIKVAKPFNEFGTLGQSYRNYLSTFTDPDHINASTRVMELPEINARGNITNHDALDIFLRDTGFHITNLDLSMLHRSSENRINYSMKGNGVKYKMAEIDGVEAAIVDSAGMLNLKAALDETSLFSGPENNWFLTGSFANWRGMTSLSVHDPLGHVLYDFGVSTRVDNNNVILEVPLKRFIINRKQWQLGTSDLLTVDRSTKTFSPVLKMHTDSSFLHLFVLDEEGIRTIKLDMNRVEMESLVREDLFPGRPDGSITGSLGLSLLEKSERKVVSDLHFSDVRYSDLKFDDILINGHLDYGDSGNYSVDMSARLDSAKVILKGVKREDGRRELQSEISHIPMNTIQPFTSETLSDLRGFISGEFDVSNATGRDLLNGQLSFNGVQLKINVLNSTFKIPDQRLLFEEDRLILNKFRVQDTLNKELLVDGFVDFSKKLVTADLNISSSKLQVMSRGDDENASFYGDVFVDSKFSVKGPLTNPTVNGEVLLTGGTEIFYRLMEDLSLSESEKILTFVSHTSPDDQMVTPVIEKQGKLMKSSVETIVKIDPATLINFSLSKRIFNIELQIKGGGKLNYNMINNNQVSLSGTYRISEGTAELKLVGWPNKSFSISEGGYIRWDGRIEDPELKFEASNRVSSSYQNPVDGKQRAVDFNVLLQLSNHLSDLDVLFTINTPDQYLMSIINTMGPEEQMRQAISILLFEIIDLPGISSSSDYMTQQVNQILASQLNQLTKSTIKGVDISFGLDTYNTSTQAGSEETTTSLSYEVSKSLLNDRAQFELSGRLHDVNQQPGASDLSLNNISFEYTLDSSATKFLKIYNEHTYEDVFEGEVVKTGIGVSYRKRYWYFRDIWKRERKKNKEKSREK
jgi:translocation and assembly module TamB